MHKLVTDPNVRQNIQAATEYYERVEPSVVDSFLNMIWECFDRISVFPNLHQKYKDEIRMAPLKDYPYVVFYKVYSDKIVVLTFLHSSQDYRQSLHLVI